MSKLESSPTTQISSQQSKLKAEENKKKKPPPQYNPRWKGYCLILISSLINLSSISNIDQQSDFSGEWGFCLCFGVFSFVFALLILILDRTQCGVETFSFTKAMDGKLEGYVLLFVSLWWLVGVAYITQVNGIAYKANNIYFSSWLVPASCAYTLNKWSTEKDVLSLAEMTGLSATLKSWYILFLSSVVSLGSSIDMLLHLYSIKQDQAIAGVVIGIVSTCLSIGWICVHYKFIEFFKQGGWQELSCCVVLIVLWIIGVSIITQEGGIGSTLGGSGCRNIDNQLYGIQITELENCTISLVGSDQERLTYNCYDTINRSIPGSNLYFSVWCCLGATLNIALRWKAQQALQFAQAQNERLMDKAKISSGDGEDGASDGEDLEDFEDADDY
jgi:hypothetical protein